MRLMMVARRSVDRMEMDGHGTPSYFHSNMRWRARAVGANTIIVTPIRVTSQGVMSSEGKHHHCNTNHTTQRVTSCGGKHHHCNTNHTSQRVTSCGGKHHHCNTHHKAHHPPQGVMSCGGKHHHCNTHHPPQGVMSCGGKHHHCNTPSSSTRVNELWGQTSSL